MEHTYDKVEVKEYVESRGGRAVKETDLSSLGLKKEVGKVRDVYTMEKRDFVILVATDRISAFDRVLGSVPCKGQVLSEVSRWWFEKTTKIVGNHVIGSPDPNVVVGKKCEVFGVEFVVRGYISGSTNTSMWTRYAAGDRVYCGLTLPEGLKQNQRLETSVLTPTTKEKEGHDRLISGEEIVSEGRMTQQDYDFCHSKALQLFALGQEIASQHGLILVDTKYEFGRDPKTGEILLVDEIHTPDSSRYWIASTYQDKFINGQAPDSIDKDVLRRWYSTNHKEKLSNDDEPLPAPPSDLITCVSLRYIELYERITGMPFKRAMGEDESVEERIKRNVSNWLQQYHG